MDSLNKEIKTALHAKIVNYKPVRYIYYYTINLSKIYSSEQHQIEKCSRAPSIRNRSKLTT